MNNTQNELQWIRNNTPKNKFYQIDVIGRTKDFQQQTTNLQIIDPTLPFNEQMKILNENIAEINSSINNLINQFQTTSVDGMGKCHEEVFNHYQQSINSLFYTNIQKQNEQMEKTMRRNKEELQMKMNNQINEYENVLKPIEQLDQTENCQKTFELFDNFEKVFVSWKPITEKIIWSYQERYIELEESQKLLSQKLEEWHKRNNLKNMIIDAVHTKSEKKIIGLFEGHRDELMKMKLDHGLLLRLILFLSQSTMNDSDKRVCFLFSFFY